jgi:E3 ubiquitin-protein ligase RNF14
MTDLVYCPRCEAPVLEEGGGDHFGQCASCELAFCTLCREAFHPGMQCMEPEERLKVLGERARGNKNAGKAERERCDANGTLQIRKLSIYVSLLLACSPASTRGSRRCVVGAGMSGCCKRRCR